MIETLKKYRRIYALSTILAIFLFSIGIWNFWISIPILIELQGNIGMLKTILYPGVVLLLICILYVIGFFKNWYWILIITFFILLKEVLDIIRLFPFLAQGVSGQLYWNTILLVDFLLMFFIANTVLIVMMGLYKILSKNQTKN